MKYQRNPCPITRRPWFMDIEHPELGEVPTYGGPFDSYTVPEVDDDGDLRCERYDHDAGAWVEGGDPLGIWLTTAQPCNHDLPNFLERHFELEIACDHPCLQCRGTGLQAGYGGNHHDCAFCSGKGKRQIEFSKSTVDQTGTN